MGYSARPAKIAAAFTLFLAVGVARTDAQGPLQAGYDDPAVVQAAMQQAAMQQAAMQQAQAQQAAMRESATMPHHGGYDDWGSATPQPNAAPTGGYGDAELWDQVHQPTRWYTALDFVGLWTRGSNIPPLVTTSGAGTLQAAAGILSNATLLFGNQRIDEDMRSGAELRLGWWMVDGQFHGLEGHYLGTQTVKTRFSAASAFSSNPNAQILALPFIDAGNSVESASLFAFPLFDEDGVGGVAAYNLDGAVDIESQSDIQSAGLLLRHVLWADFDRNVRVDFIGGYRFFQLDESLTIRASRLRPAIGPDDPILTQTTDLFDAQNDFHGGDVGLQTELFSGRWSLELLGKVGLGNMRETVTIRGQTTNTQAGAVALFDGGVFAQPTNSGSFARDKFAVLPEGHVKLHCSLLDNLRINLGYRVLWLNEAVRPGDQIDRTVNVSQFGGGTLNGAPRPAQTFHSTSLWIQGIDAGVELRY